MLHSVCLCICACACLYAPLLKQCRAGPGGMWLNLNTAALSAFMWLLDGEEGLTRVGGSKMAP